MIRVNLIVTRGPIRGIVARRQVMVFGLIFLLVAGGVGYYWQIQSGQISALNEEIANLNRQLGPLKKQVEKVKKFEARKTELEAKVKVIDDLEMNRSGPSKVLYEISLNLPDQVWLTQLSEVARDAQGGMMLEGFAFSNVDITEFMKQLEASKVFTAIDLLESKEAEVENIKVQKFRLRLRRFPPPREPNLKKEDGKKASRQPRQRPA